MKLTTEISELLISSVETANFKGIQIQLENGVSLVEISAKVGFFHFKSNISSMKSSKMKSELKKGDISLEYPYKLKVEEQNDKKISGLRAS